MFTGLMTFSQSMKLAVRLLVRDWRAGELHVLLSALVIAVAASTSIEFFTDRISRGMDQQSAEFLGGDLVLSSSRPVEQSWLTEASSRRLQVVQVLSFASMVLNGDQLQLGGIKAVSKHYPPRGQVRVASIPFAQGQAVNTIPKPGMAWLDSRLFASLGIALDDEIRIGESDFIVSQVLAFEPGSPVNLLGVAPRVLINMADVGATRVVQPGSRLTYQYLLAGEQSRILNYADWLGPRLQAGQQLAGGGKRQRMLGTALERAQLFLGLSVMAAMMLAGVAIAMASRRYSERHFDMSAMLRCLGASQGELLRLYVPQLLFIGLLGSAMGVLLGWLAQYGLMYLLADLLPGVPATTGWQPVFNGFATGMVILTGFALPPLVALKSVPPLRVLRRDLLPMPPASWLIYAMALAAIILLMWRYTDNWRLIFTLLAGASVMLLVLGILALFVMMLPRFQSRRVGVAWRFGLQNLWRRRRVNLVQIMAFALVLMAMAVIALVRTDLLHSWRTQLPNDAPNQFVINILSDQVEDFSKFLQQQDISSSTLYPLVRGRLSTIDGASANQAVPGEAANDNALNRELNLTWSQQLQPDNKIVEGRWFEEQDIGKARVSVETELARRLNIKLGDELGFDIHGKLLNARVTSIRTVHWDSLRPNFFIMFPPGVLEGLPATWMTSFYLPSGQESLLLELARQFPAATLIDLNHLLGQVQSILQQVTMAVEYVLVFVLLAGLVVLFAALQASLDERLYEGALLRALGGSRSQLRSGHLAEFLALGLMSGLVAAIGTEVLSWQLYSRLLQLDYSFKWQVWLMLPVAGAAIIGAAGYWGTRIVVRQSPLAVFYRL
jgi:putative ABC transport system permease protein